ncbi:MAG TPA: mismatch-specific DNA-glycosylase [Geminicoccus sp.]|jgi:TDG/mug DNA glycosylase family protein|uniref:mismatch-specific DNA-glycosylase n=1 Tax=Geminicoccus sp. TaxID=2024832 RepID=UPI002E3346A5|nr:mismatch-specific DNA-glycosylase [Geminicoccus sp.]HEX2527693.1 mismatch-specific DNA-glycosylase [Geminicoccus sp.]
MIEAATRPAGSTDDILCDVLRPALRAVFVGMAAGKASAAKGRHYAGPGNKFWSVLAAVRLTPERLTPDRERELLGHGLGLTDMQKRQSGADAEINVGPADVELARCKLRANRPAAIAFNGKRAAAYWLGTGTTALRYGPMDDPHGVVPELFILPLTSGAASGFWDVRPWIELAGRLTRSWPDEAALRSGTS